jgi:hypothetical protein
MAAVPNSLLLLVALVLFISACGGSPPEILFADAQLFLVDDRESGTRHESLRLYVAVGDGDGVEDLSLLSVVHDESELYWQASSEDWTVVEQDGDSWIGLPDMRAAPGEPFPRGRYRLVLEDYSLQETESGFGITASALDPHSVTFPFLETSAEGTRLVADGPVVVRIFTRTQKLVVSREVSPGLVDDSLFRELPNEAGLEAYLSTPPGPAVRLMSGPFEVQR